MACVHTSALKINLRLAFPELMHAEHSELFHYSCDRFNIFFDPDSRSSLSPGLNLPYLIEMYGSNQIFSNNFHLLFSEKKWHYVFEECIVISGWSPSEWGHFCVETFPKLIYMLGLMGGQASLPPIYISESTSQSVISDIKACLDAYEYELKFYSKNSITVFSQAWCPPALNLYGDLGYYPDLRSSISDFISSRHADSLATVKSEKIYISRIHSGYKGLTTPRPIVNESEIIDVLRAAGYLIINGHEFDLLEKISMLKNASVICGGFGSGLHNSIFATVKAKIVSFGYGISSIQKELCELVGQSYLEFPTFFDARCTRVMYDIKAKSQYVSRELLDQAMESGLM